mgnify:CR=1 FL=1
MLAEVMDVALPDAGPITAVAGAAAAPRPVVNPATGETVKSYRQLLGFDTVPLGDVLVGAGPDVVARLVDP